MILEGLILEGLTLDSQSNFNSIPGLVLWLDTRNRKTASGGSIVDWSSKTTDARLFSAPVSAQRPFDTDPFVDFDDVTNTQGRQLRTAKSNVFNFFHDGSPFGYFEIMGFKQAASGLTASRTFTTRAGSGSGANISISADNRLIYQCVNSGSLVIGAQTGINTLTEETILSVAVTRNSLNQSNNLKFYIQNTLSTQNSVTAVASGDSSSLAVGLINAKRYIPCLKLLYDWTGYTSSEVESFSSEVRAIVEQEKTSFTYPT